MFLNEKPNGIIKGCRCADGWKQCIWTRKEDASSPTVATESVLLTSVIEAKEQNRNMSKSKGWTLQSSLLTLSMEKTRVNNQTKIDDNENLLKSL